MNTAIFRNGSKWAGELPDPLETLLARLETNTLDPRFEHYGNFMMSESGGQVHFFGNFADISHVFGIVTDDPSWIARLGRAIDTNKDTTAYRTLRDNRFNGCRCRVCIPSGSSRSVP